MTIEITLKLANESPAQALGLLYYSEEGVTKALQAETDADGRLSFGDVATCSEMLIIFFGGFWTIMLNAGQLPKVLICPPLPACNGRMWWQGVLGIDEPDPGAGEGIVVGVIDTPLAPTSGLDHVSVLTLAGNPNPAPFGQVPSHGETVCRLIGHRMKDSAHFGGVAPAADLICIDAEVEASLNPAVVSSAIVKLARDYHCDLINLSAGRREPTEGLRHAIYEARQYGTLCLVAAGNDPHDKVSFPARYPECIAVGAIGLRGWGPDCSFARYLSNQVASQAALLGKVGDHEIFHYPKSAYGQGLDVVAPGVGLIVHRDDQPMIDATGTSFASPLVTGLLALVLGKSNEYKELPRGPERADFAEGALRAICRRTGIAVEREGAGLPRLTGIP
jgi:hypothetical protein